MKKSFNITTPARVEEIRKATNSNGISIYVENSRDLYLRLEALSKCCLKHFKKYGGLDIDYLANSSTMKAITRDARKELLNYDERHTMQEDATARVVLAVSVYDYCVCS